MSRIATLAAGLALSIALPGLASAATVTVRDNPDNGNSVFASGLSSNITIEHNGSQRNVGAGVFSLQFGSDADGWTDFLTFCLQLDEFLSLPRDHERVAGSDYFLSEADRNALGVLYNKFLNNMLGIDTGTEAAALQAIIWEITEDGADMFDLTSGNFQLLSQGALSAANDLWLMISMGQMEAMPFDVFRARHTQDLLTSTVPIPGAAFLLLSGIFGLSFASRKQKTIS